MATLELTAPVRLYWDFDRAGGNGNGVARASVDPLAVCEQVIDSGILFVALRDLDTPPRSELAAVTDRLLAAGRSVSVTVRPVALDDFLRAVVSRDALPKAQLLLHADDEGGVQEVISMIHEYAEAPSPPGLSVAQTDETLQRLPEIVRRCVEAGVGLLEVPIPRIGDRRNPDPGEYATLRRELEPIDYDSLRVILHDPFLWEAFNPGGTTQGGCQAGGGMLHISGSYEVFPCAMMPLPLGQLGDGDLKSILGSKRRLEIRRSLQEIPAQCRSCVAAGHCLGGCRGRAYLDDGQLGGCDPACPRAPTAE